MKNNILSVALFGIATILIGGVQAQSCNYFHKRNCVSESEIPMQEDTQSKSALFSKGQQSDFNMVAYKGQDYRIVLCTDEIFSEPLEFRIYEKVRVRIDPAAEAEAARKEEPAPAKQEEAAADDDGWGNTASYDSYSDDSWGDSGGGNNNSGGGEYKETKFKLVKELLYDNKEDGMVQEIEFTAENTKSLTIEVKVPGEAVQKKLKIKEVGCVGVMVEHTKSGGLGF